MATLVYSTKCPYCKELFDFIQQNPEVRPQIRIHDIADGLPSGIDRVPAIIVGNDVHTGMKCKNYIMNMINQEEIPAGGTGVHFVSIDGTNECSTGSEYCDLMEFGRPKAAPMTPEFAEKMRKKVE